MWLLKTDTRYLIFGGFSGLEQIILLPDVGRKKAILSCTDKCCHLDEYVSNNVDTDIIILEEWQPYSNDIHITFKEKGIIGYNFKSQWYRANMMAYYYVSGINVTHRMNHDPLVDFYDCGKLEFTFNYKCEIIFKEAIVNCGYNSLVSVLNRTLKNEPGQ
jgi:hypothetical protein